MTVGDNEYLSATTSPSGQSVSWNSSNSGVASVNSSGRVSAVGPGSTTITAEFRYGDGNYKQSCSVSVSELDYILEFDGNGGAVSIASKTFVYGTPYGTLPTPTHEGAGYTFDGWFTSPNGGTQVYATTIASSRENQRIYAHWNFEEIWGGWSEWSDTPVYPSNTRQVETSTKQDSGHTEYRYGRYIDSSGAHASWCATYLNSLGYGGASINYSSWSISQYAANSTGWTCGFCDGNHIGVSHYSSDGRAWWAEYILPSGSYFWEESKWVEGQTYTVYRYRDRLN